MPELQLQQKQLFVVTAAPKVWANKALEYMQLKSYFLSILTLEDYGHSKAEAFRKISENAQIPLSQMMSIGDQEHSDIVPAQKI
jgi:FMN phosphatase YigB (HAD superfamily)